MSTVSGELALKYNAQVPVGFFPKIIQAKRLKENHTAVVALSNFITIILKNKRKIEIAPEIAKRKNGLLQI